MYTNPSAVKVIQCVRQALTESVLAEVQTDKARVVLGMIDQMLLSVERRIPVEHQWMADECNRMVSTMGAIAGSLGQVGGSSAAAYRLLADRAAFTPAFVEVPAFEEIALAYLALSEWFTEGLGLLNDLVAKVPRAPRRCFSRRAPTSSSA